MVSHRFYIIMWFWSFSVLILKTVLTVKTTLLTQRKPGNSPVVTCDISWGRRPKSSVTVIFSHSLDKAKPTFES
jgi:hypothetical protein